MLRCRMRSVTSNGFGSIEIVASGERPRGGGAEDPLAGGECSLVEVNCLSESACRFVGFGEGVLCGVRRGAGGAEYTGAVGQGFLKHRDRPPGSAGGAFD